MLFARTSARGLGFSKEDRDTNIRRIGFVSDLLTRNGVVSIVSAISPYREVRDEVREQIGDFIEVHVHASLDELVKRDVKGLYEKALKGEIQNFTGVSDPYEEPLSTRGSCRHGAGRGRGEPRQGAWRARGAGHHPVRREQGVGGGGDLDHDNDYA